MKKVGKSSCNVEKSDVLLLHTSTTEGKSVMEAGTKVTIKSDAFKGYVSANGRKGKIAAKEKGSKEPMMGLGGTYAVDFSNGTRAYATESQFDVG